VGKIFTIAIILSPFHEGIIFCERKFPPTPTALAFVYARRFTRQVGNGRDALNSAKSEYSFITGFFRSLSSDRADRVWAVPVELSSVDAITVRTPDIRA
jgi:hypothetical protein